MHFKKVILISLFLLFFSSAVIASLPAQPKETQSQNTGDSDQQINDFSLSGYGEKGKKSWDLAGKSADIFTDIVKLKDVIGNLYGKEENINLTAQRGDFNKADGKIHLEKDVVITTSSGTILTTDSLDWDRRNQLVDTKDAVNIVRDNMVIDAVGAHGQPNLKKVSLEKDVKLDINPTDKENSQGPKVQEKIIITCDGPLEIDYEKNIATFNRNVKVTRPDSIIYSDIMHVYFIPSSQKKEEEKSEDSAKVKDANFMGSSIDKIIAQGNVKVVKGENTSYSEEAVYSATDKRLVLTGRPKLVIYSTEELSGASFGD